MITDVEGAAKVVVPIEQMIVKLNDALLMAAQSGIRIEISTTVARSVGFEVGYPYHPVVVMAASIPLTEKH